MGYRSEWQLLVVGTEKQVREFEDWMHEKQEEAAEGSSARLTDTWDTIRSSRNDETEHFSTLQFPERDSGGALDLDHPVVVDAQVGISFSYDFTKCYPPWDDVIEQIFERIEECNMDAAYGRLGEDPQDVELRDCGKRVYVSMTRSLTKPFDNY
jgi:hypothetical protein